MACAMCWTRVCAIPDTSATGGTLLSRPALFVWDNEARSDSLSIVLRSFGGAAAIVLAAYLGFEVLRWLSKRLDTRFPGIAQLAENARKPVRLIVGILAARVVSDQIANLREGWVDGLDHVLQIAMIVAIVWLAISAVGAVEDQILKNDSKKERGPVDRRRVETQVSLLRRLVVAVLISIGVVAILMTFPSVRTLGAGLLASAGLISIIAGLAAQTSLTNVFAGIQLALSDSVRVREVVVANGQSGTIAQLTLTNVELRLWDGRVLILPSSFFYQSAIRELDAHAQPDRWECLSRCRLVHASRCGACRGNAHPRRVGSLGWPAKFRLCRRYSRSHIATSDRCERCQYGQSLRAPIDRARKGRRVPVRALSGKSGAKPHASAFCRRAAAHRYQRLTEFARTLMSERAYSRFRSGRYVFTVFRS